MFIDEVRTPPIHVGETVLGEKEGEVQPFEVATVDFGHINDYLLRNPAYQTHIVPDAMVNSCSQCCMTEVNGKSNILGWLFRKSREGKGCRLCPVSLASEKLLQRKADGTYLRDITGHVLSEAEMVVMAMDGEK